MTNNRGAKDGGIVRSEITVEIRIVKGEVSAVTRESMFDQNKGDSHEKKKGGGEGDGIILKPWLIMLHM